MNDQSTSLPDDTLIEKELLREEVNINEKDRRSGSGLVVRGAVVVRALIG